MQGNETREGERYSSKHKKLTLPGNQVMWVRASRGEQGMSMVLSYMPVYPEQKRGS